MTNFADYIPFDIFDYNYYTVRIWQKIGEPADLIAAITYPDLHEEAMQLPYGCTDYKAIIEVYLDNPAVSK